MRRTSQIGWRQPTDDLPNPVNRYWPGGAGGGGVSLGWLGVADGWSLGAGAGSVGVVSVGAGGGAAESSAPEPSFFAQPVARAAATTQTQMIVRMIVSSKVEIGPTSHNARGSSITSRKSFARG